MTEYTEKDLFDYLDFHSYIWIPLDGDRGYMFVFEPTNIYEQKKTPAFAKMMTKKFGLTTAQGVYLFSLENLDTRKVKGRRRIGRRMPEPENAETTRQDKGQELGIDFEIDRHTQFCPLKEISKEEFSKLREETWVLEADFIKSSDPYINFKKPKPVLRGYLLDGSLGYRVWQDMRIEEPHTLYTNASSSIKCNFTELVS